MKQYETLGFCPVCEQSLLVTQLSCQCCKTQMNGQYRLNKFSYLPKELLVFTEVFLKNRGNIKEVERELGISYPTVRRMLDQTIQSLGYQTTETTLQTHEILDRIEKGEMTVREAMELLKR
ncbi:DUF2089 domain-containing protein [Turicibacter sanguinis]|uniref:DUF2089 domain-containing protein n=1 Tax=Turicibacter sanguinis TaxID=154288 RepID=UPI0012BC01AD|nr:DUF2089 family protein [Turicibacter sanguinis]MTN49731.1 DUF2089 family protein [Turicibacter sanguinis]MTN52762.1 DUF2089 family protein [Turicibacter sanguinis]MTN56012.1 DUF2089 family protein [Turicibacter sanguinis]MTN59076.1 DUF2089 family protein [Turicibacter sanguinis]